MQSRPWHIVTGEYTPAPGGVADYTRSVAAALASSGDEVHVWAPSPPSGQPFASDPGVTIHALTHGFGPLGLLQLRRGLRAHRGPRRVLLQYVPHAFGARAMNVPLCAFLRSLREDEVWVLFHEVAVPWGELREWKQNVIAAVNRWMARLLVARADRIFVTVPAWERLLRRIAPACPPATWLPVPSNVPLEVPIAQVRALREKLGAAPGAAVIGHFGNHPYTTATVARAMGALLLRDERRIALFIGRGGEAIARDLGADRRFDRRVVATGGIELREIATHLSACDVLVQPYGDGVSGRRTSLMAGLALGRPIVTNVGAQTESIWRESMAVSLVDSDEALAAAADAVLNDPELAAGLGGRASALYRNRFALERTIEVLRNGPKDKVASGTPSSRSVAPFF
jgi:glycosyltransferase involved in cell wall biosynthesis